MNRRCFLTLPSVAVAASAAISPSKAPAPSTIERETDSAQRKRRRLKRMFISRELLPDLIRGGPVTMLLPWNGDVRLKLITAPTLPPDLEIIHSQWDFGCDGLILVCRSETFEEVDVREGTIPDLPFLNPIFHQEYLDAAGVAAMMESVRRKTLGDLAEVRP